MKVLGNYMFALSPAQPLFEKKGRAMALTNQRQASETKTTLAGARFPAPGTGFLFMCRILIGLEWQCYLQDDFSSKSTPCKSAQTIFIGTFCYNLLNCLH